MSIPEILSYIIIDLPMLYFDRLFLAILEIFLVIENIYVVYSHVFVLSFGYQVIIFLSALNFLFLS